MGRLKRVQRIDAANNMLVRVPPSMGYLKTIKELNLRYNNLDDKYKAKAEEGLSRQVSANSSKSAHHNLPPAYNVT